MPSEEILKSHFLSVEEFSQATGKVIGRSSWFEITQQRIDDFAVCTLDQQWIHIDSEKARLHSPYGKTIAHGFLITSLIPMFLAETISIDKVSMGINYGSDRIRFTNAVKVDQKIRAIITLLEVQQIENGVKYKTEVRIEIQGESKPACVAELLALLYKS